MRARRNHDHLDENGIGCCSVPMWQMGMECFCDEPAYGVRPPNTEGSWTNAYTGEVMRHDGRYNGYVPGLACYAHGGPRARVFKDGVMYCAVYKDFVNVQESPAGFGETPELAQAALSQEAQP
jgi:hypothetical protein